MKKRRQISFFLVASVVIFGVAIVGWFNLANRNVKAAWFDDNYGYRQTIAVTNSGAAQTDFQVVIVFDTATLITAGKMQSDCDDIRLTDPGGVQLPIWLDKGEKGCNKSTTQIWTKMPSIPTTASTIFLYYGNPGAVNVENGDNIFLFFDDFSGDTLNSTRWPTTSLVGTGSLSVASGVADVNGGTAGTALIQTTYDPPTTAVVFETRTNFIIQGSGKDRNRWVPSIAGTDRGVFHDGTNLKVYWSNAFQTNNFTTDTFYRLKQTTDGTNFAWAVTTDTGTAFFSNTAVSAVNQNNMSINAGDGDTNQGGRMKIDYVFFRKYASTEPTIGSPSSEEKSPGPVAYWKFDDGTGTTARNSAPSGNGTVAGATWQTDDLCAAGKCLNFDGVNDNVQITETSAIDLGATTDSYTLAAWVRTSTDFSANATIIAKDDGSGAYPASLYINSGEKACFAISDGTNAPAICHPTGVSNGLWHYVTGVRDVTNDKLFIYLDGVSASNITDSTTATAVNNDNWSIGNSGATYTANDFTGFIDEAKVYNYVRSADQIKLDYNSKKAAVAKGAGTILGAGSNAALNSGLVGYWKLDESTGDAADSSGNGTTLTNTNSATFTTGKYGNSGAMVSASAQLFAASDNQVLSMGTGQDFTLSAWVYLTTNNSEMVIMSKSGPTREYMLRFGGLSGTTFNCGTTGGNVEATDFGTPNTNTWYFLTCQYNSAKQELSLSVNDGLPRVASGITPAVDSTMDFAVGSEGNGGSHSWNGRIDEARIYKRILSPSEQTQLYNFAPGPVSYWNFEEGGGTTTVDTSGNGYTSSAFSGNVAWTQGKFGKGLSFDGTDDVVRVVEGTYTDLGLTTDQYSVGAWMKTSTNYSASTSIIAKDDGSGAYPYALYLNSSEQACFQISDGTNSPSACGSTALNDGNWHYLTGVRNVISDKVFLYVDGVAITSTTDSTTATAANNDDLSIGNGGTSYVGNDFNGQIDEVKIYNYPRSQKQIVEDLNGGHPAGGSPVGSQMGYWKFDEGQGTAANDSSVNRNNGTLTLMSSPASVGISGWNPNGRFGKAISFDGSNDYVDLGTGSSLNTTTNNFTLSAWILTSQSTEGHIISRGGSGGANATVVRINGAAAGKVDSRISSSTAVVSKTTVNDNKWHHVAVVVNRTGMASVYVDGLLEASGDISGTSANSITDSNWAVGVENLAAKNHYFNGTIDEVKLYNFALTAEEVKLDFNRGQAVNFGVLGTSTYDGKTASNSAATAYCVPGDTTSCNAPVAEWNFEQRTGTSALDTSGNGLTGTLTGAATWGQGKFGAGVSLAANGDYVTIPDNDNLDFSTGNGTIETWVNCPSSETDGFVIQKRVEASTLGYNVFIGTSNLVRFQIGDGTNTVTDSLGTVGVCNNAWHQIVMVIDRTNNLGRIYIDGVQDRAPFSISTVTGTISNTQALELGRAANATSYLVGRIDATRLYKYVRTPAQIAYSYNRGLPVSWWKMDECQGSTVFDSMGNNNGVATGSIGTCSDNASTMRYNGRNGKYNSSLAFDGNDDYVTIGSSLELLEPTNDWSIAAWVYPTSIPNTFNTIYAESKTDDTNPRFSYYVGSTGLLSFVAINDADDPSWYIESLNQVPLNTWSHAVLTKSGNNLTVCINAKCNSKVQTFSGTFTFNSTTLGLNNRGGLVEEFNGQLDDVKVWKYPLTTYQIRNEFNQGAAVRFGPQTGTP